VINTIPFERKYLCVIAKEILEIISKLWCSNQDIMKIANVSASTASKIKQSIEKEFRKKEPNKFMPAYCIPTKEVIKYFDLDIEFLKSIAYFDKEINDGLPK
jgi:predicted transcriptional regulator